MKQNISCKASVIDISVISKERKDRETQRLIFNDLGKKFNDRIKVCILVKTTNLCELILAVVPLCYEIYNLYSANSSRPDKVSAHWAAILDFVYVLVLCNCGHDLGTSEEFDAVRLAKTLIISWG